MNYIEKSYDEVFMKMLTDAFEERLISHDEEFLDYISNRKDISNFYVMLLSIHSEAIAEVYKAITEVYKSSKVDYAVDGDLDDLGDIVDCPRPQATYAYVELTFTHRTESSMNVPAGITVSNKSGISYTTLEPLNFTSENNNVTVTAKADIPGVAGRVSENTLTKIESRVSSLLVTNPKPSTGGTDSFNDEQYRELLKNWIKSKQKGNYYAYLDYFSRLDGLDDYHIVPNWDGTGTVKVLLSPSNSYFLNKVYNELQDTVTQITEDIVVMPPTSKSVDIYVDCNVDIDRLNPYSNTEKEIIKGRLIDETRKYIDTLRIGEDFIPHKLAVWLDNNISELKNITFAYPSMPVEVLDDEKCQLGTVEINME